MVSIVVEHEKRKQQILEKALAVFIREGYPGTTYQKIADECGITRTTLYVYYKNKRQIFQESIKKMNVEIEQALLAISAEPSSEGEKLKALLNEIFCQLELRVDLLRVIVEYLNSLGRKNSDPWHPVRRRILRLKHHFTRLLIDGQENGTLQDLPIRPINDLLYGLIEAAVFRLTLLKKDSVEELKKAGDQYITGLQINQQE